MGKAPITQYLSIIFLALGRFWDESDIVSISKSLGETAASLQFYKMANGFYKEGGAQGDGNTGEGGSRCRDGAGGGVTEDPARDWKVKTTQELHVQRPKGEEAVVLANPKWSRWPESNKGGHSRRRHFLRTGSLLNHDFEVCDGRVWETCCPIVRSIAYFYTLFTSFTN